MNRISCAQLTSYPDLAEPEICTDPLSLHVCTCMHARQYFFQTQCVYKRISLIIMNIIIGPTNKISLYVYIYNQSRLAYTSTSKVLDVFHNY